MALVQSRPGVLASVQVLRHSKAMSPAVAMLALTSMTERLPMSTAHGRPCLGAWRRCRVGEGSRG